jgi:hypothetical protein
MIFANKVFTTPLVSENLTCGTLSSDLTVTGLSQELTVLRINNINVEKGIMGEL